MLSSSYPVNGNLQLPLRGGHSKGKGEGGGRAREKGEERVPFVSPSRAFARPKFPLPLPLLTPAAQATAATIISPFQITGNSNTPSIVVTDRSLSYTLIMNVILKF